jgi:thymidine phosphorylase
MVHVKVGDPVEVGQPILTLHANDADKLRTAQTLARSAISYSAEPVAPLPHIYETLVGKAK